jgi:hypothetical protein
VATVKFTLSLDGSKLQTSSMPQLVGTQGTNFPLTGQYAFDGTSTERLFLRFQALNFGSGSITVTIGWYAATATTGGVVWESAIAAMTPNTDTTSWETKGFATVNTATDTHLGTTAQRPHSIDITASNTDSLAANDWVVLRISRLPADAGDTMSGDAVLVSVDLAYSDT